MLKDIRLCGWATLLALVILVVGGIIGGFSPPPAPTASAREISEMYMAHSSRVLIFALSMNVASTLWLLPMVVVTVAMRRMEPRSLLLPLLHLIGCIFVVVGPFLSSMFWAAAAYRPGSLPDLVQAHHDLGIFINQAGGPAWLQGFAVAIAIFRDRSPLPILPKWLAWVNIIYGLGSQPTLGIPFFKDGPFAWNGIVGFGIPMICTIVWGLATAAAIFQIKPQQWAEAERI